MKKKKRLVANMKEQMHISNDRGPTFVGIRSTVFKDARHPNRRERKADVRKQIKEEGI